MLTTRPELRLDSARPTVEQLAARLASMWMPDETVLYIGLAGTSLSTRVTAYYRTPLGARSPHAGGWPLKTLSLLPRLYVHFAAAPAPAEEEDRLASAFVGGVDAEAAACTVDPGLPLPFANLRSPRGRAKRHGITGAREPRAEGLRQTGNLAVVASARPAAYRVTTNPSSRDAFRLNVTAGDLKAGQVRVTREPKRALGLPMERTAVDILLRGRPLRVAWDPRFDDDQERSGLLRIGRDAARTLIGQPCALTLQVGEDGALVLD
ncbi:MAG: hypothetical protein LH624_08960 [Cryobacterium sp.]|nr:hypothetical protein [Cryobacterium sp.]